MDIRPRDEEASHRSRQKYEMEKSNQQAGSPRATRPIRTNHLLPLKGNLSQGMEGDETGQ